MPVLRALKPFRDRWTGRKRYKHELFTLDDEEEAARLIGEGYAVYHQDPLEKQPADDTPAPEKE